MLLRWLKGIILVATWKHQGIIGYRNEQTARINATPAVQVCRSESHFNLNPA